VARTIDKRPSWTRISLPFSPEFVFGHLPTVFTTRHHFLTAASTTVHVPGGFFPSREWKAEKWQEQSTRPSWTRISLPFSPEFVFSQWPPQKPNRVILTANSMTLPFKVYPTHASHSCFACARDQRHHEYMVDKSMAWIFFRIRFRSLAQSKAR
jgi:hypothetical protein